MRSAVGAVAFPGEGNLWVDLLRVLCLMQRSWRKMTSHSVNKGHTECQMLLGNKMLLTDEPHRLFASCLSELALQCIKPGPGFNVAQESWSLCPFEAPENVQNSKSFPVDNAIENLVTASVGV